MKKLVILLALAALTTGCGDVFKNTVAPSTVTQPVTPSVRVDKGPLQTNGSPVSILD